MHRLNAENEAIFAFQDLAIALDDSIHFAALQGRRDLRIVEQFSTRGLAGRSWRVKLNLGRAAATGNARDGSARRGRGRSRGSRGSRGSRWGLDWGKAGLGRCGWGGRSGRGDRLRLLRTASQQNSEQEKSHGRVFCLWESWPPEASLGKEVHR